MNLSLEYKIREPKVVLAENPVLILLHGYGSNEADLFSFASELPEHYYIIQLERLMIYNTEVMLGMPSILMLIKTNFRITIKLVNLVIALRTLSTNYFKITLSTKKK